MAPQNRNLLRTCGNLADILYPRTHPQLGSITITLMLSPGYFSSLAKLQEPKIEVPVEDYSSVLLLEFVMCCSVLQCVAVCCSVLQSVAVRSSSLPKLQDSKIEVLAEVHRRLPCVSMLHCHTIAQTSACYHISYVKGP